MNQRELIKSITCREKLLGDIRGEKNLCHWLNRCEFIRKRNKKDWLLVIKWEKGRKESHQVIQNYQWNNLKDKINIRILFLYASFILREEECVQIFCSTFYSHESSVQNLKRVSLFFFPMTFISALCRRRKDILARSQAGSMATHFFSFVRRAISGHYAKSQINMKF